MICTDHIARRSLCNDCPTCNELYRGLVARLVGRKFGQIVHCDKAPVGDECFCEVWLRNSKRLANGGTQTENAQRRTKRATSLMCFGVGKRLSSGGKKLTPYGDDAATARRPMHYSTPDSDATPLKEAMYDATANEQRARTVAPHRPTGRVYPRMWSHMWCGLGLGHVSK